MSDRRGHIKISRKFFEEDPWWNQRRTFSKAEAWLDFLHLAAYRSRVYVTSDGPIPLDRGQLVASYRYLASRWRWSVKMVRTWCQTGIAGARIRAHRETPAGTVYSIVNYDYYQTGGTATGTAVGTPEGIEGAQLGHSKGTRKKQLNNKAGKETWLTPFADAWAHAVGEPPFGKLAAVLGPLVKQHDAGDVMARWFRYLGATDPQYASPHRFAETFNKWAGPEIQDMTDDLGRMVPHRKVDGQWVPVVSVA